jgi:DNA-binding transcriptional MerR regulator
MAILRFTIGEVASLLNITPKTIRHYQGIGLVEAPQRDANNYRLYDMAHIERLQRVLQLKRFGLSLEQIRVIVHADDADRVVQVVLRQHADHLRDEIARLQQELSVTENFLGAGTIDPPKPQHSAMIALTTAIKPRAAGVADILMEVERDVLLKLDGFDWGGDYESFWHRAGQHFIETLAEEGLFIFWMERYLALAGMAADDLQAKAWLSEFQTSPARGMIARSFTPPPVLIMPRDDQERAARLLVSLLYEHSAPLQRQFLRLILRA